MSECKPCNQCWHYLDGECFHENTYTKISYITCEKAQEYKSCERWRTNAMSYAPERVCGKEAKWFEEIPPPPEPSATSRALRATFWTVVVIVLLMAIAGKIMS